MCVRLGGGRFGEVGFLFLVNLQRSSAPLCVHAACVLVGVGVCSTESVLNVCVRGQRPHGIAIQPCGEAVVASPGMPCSLFSRFVLPLLLLLLTCLKSCDKQTLFVDSRHELHTVCVGALNDSKAYAIKWRLHTQYLCRSFACCLCIAQSPRQHTIRLACLKLLCCVE